MARRITGKSTLLAGFKALRLRLAKARGVPAHIVLPDRTVLDMVRWRPHTEAEFAEVNASVRRRGAGCMARGRTPVNGPP